jgi:uncharacterized membrane protein YccF (DUF307 family)
MSILGNIIWFLFGGFFVFVHYLFAGLALCITIIGIPFGLQVFKMAGLALWPFDKEIVDKERGTGCIAVLMNLLWLFIGGIWIALHHLVWAILLGITIIGIPFASQHVKLAVLALTPFGKEVK